MKKLLLSFLITPLFSVAQYNVDYTVTILRLKANADDCDGGAPFCINAPQDPVFNIWTNDGGGNINTNCWIYEDDNAAAYGQWIDIQNLEIANETGVNTSYIDIEMAGHESDAIGSASCSPDSGDDAVVSQQLAQQFDLLLIPENVPYFAEVNIQSTYFAEIEIVWDNNDTGIDELSGGIEFNVYPNPSEGIFNIQLGPDFTEFNFEVIDLSGRTVTNGSVSGANHELDMQQLNGAYFLKVTSHDKMGIKKIMIQ